MKQTLFQTLLLSIVLFISFSCSKKSDEKDFEIKEGTGTVWLSGGLYFCAVQIRMEKGDTLIPFERRNEIKIRFNGDDRVNVKYREIVPKQSGCSIGIDCEIIEIKLIE